MKNQNTIETNARTPLRLNRPTATTDGLPTPLDPLQEEAIHRRLYTDFLALALYPGMRLRGPDRPEDNRGISAA